MEEPNSREIAALRRMRTTSLLLSLGFIPLLIAHVGAGLLSRTTFLAAWLGWLALSLLYMALSGRCPRCRARLGSTPRNQEPNRCLKCGLDVRAGGFV